MFYIKYVSVLITLYFPSWWISFHKPFFSIMPSLKWQRYLFLVRDGSRASTAIFHLNGSYSMWSGGFWHWKECMKKKLLFYIYCDKNAHLWTGYALLFPLCDTLKRNGLILKYTRTHNPSLICHCWSSDSTNKLSLRDAVLYFKRLHRNKDVSNSRYQYKCSSNASDIEMKQLEIPPK